MKPLSGISTTRPSCKISFNICVDCGKLFAAKRKNKLRCTACNDPVTKARRQKGLKEHTRICLNPNCGKEFKTYNERQFACSAECSNAVTNIKRNKRRKILKSSRLCTNCGAEVGPGATLCAGCRGLQTTAQIMWRFKLKTNGLCRECGKNPVEDGQYRCDDCRAVMRERREPLQCHMEGCHNDVVFGHWYCQECLELKEAEKNSCKVHFSVCLNCGGYFTSKRDGKKHCSSYCIRESQLSKPIKRKCDVCGCVYELKSGVNFYKTCSVECMEELKSARRRDAKHVRRLRKANQFVERINIFKLFKRDGGRCQICGAVLNLERQVPHPLSATMDHIIPLAKGGEHSYKNIQLACFECNCLKGDRIVDDKGGIYRSIVEYYVDA